MVARSSVEAEYEAMTLGICELIWIKKLLRGLHIESKGRPIKLYCDNKTTISIAYNPLQYDRINVSR